GVVAHLRARAEDHVDLALARTPEQLIDEMTNQIELLGWDPEVVDRVLALDRTPRHDGVNAFSEQAHRYLHGRSREPVQHRDVRPALRARREALQREERQRDPLAPRDDDVVLLGATLHLARETCPPGDGALPRAQRAIVQDRLVVPLREEVVEEIPA